MAPKEEVELLMNAGIPFAEQMLREHGEFFPFGEALKPNGQIVSVGASDGTEQPRSQVLIDLLFDGFRKAAANGQYIAIALFVDVKVARPGSSTKGDAVQVSLEHRNGYSADVFFPYHIVDGRVHFDKLFAQARDPMVFKLH